MRLSIVAIALTDPSVVEAEGVETLCGKSSRKTRPNTVAPRGWECAGTPGDQDSATVWLSGYGEDPGQAGLAAGKKNKLLVGFFACHLASASAVVSHALVATIRSPLSGTSSL